MTSAPFSATSPRLGFTLLELSVVLVLIGLLSGSVLVGMDLVRAAKLRAETGLLEQYQTAVHTFRSKYNALPGDLAEEQDVGLEITPGHFGDGDGLVTYANGPEPVFIWEHLSAAQLIGGRFDGTVTGLGCPITACPPSRFGDHATHLMGGALALNYGFPVYTSPYSDSDAFLSVIIRSAANISGSDGHLTVLEAHGLDVKLDDGKADAGRLLTANPGAASTGCVDGAYSDPSGNVNYVLTYAGQGCLILYVFR